MAACARGWFTRPMPLNRRERSSKWILAAAALAALVAAAMPTDATSSAANGFPLTIAAIGDSITAGACTDLTCADRPMNSWATGTNITVQSQLLRIRKVVNHRHGVAALNLATSRNVTMADFAGQAAHAVAAHATFITVELGENDLCQNTRLTTFDEEVRAGLQLITQKEPDAKILLLSIEDLAQHWRVLRTASSSAAAFKAGAEIDCGLGYTVTHTRIAQITRQTTILNGILASECHRYSSCRYDGGIYFRLPITASDFSPADYQHLSLAGQRALSAAEWRAVIKAPTLLLS